MAVFLKPEAYTQRTRFLDAGSEPDQDPGNPTVSFRGDRARLRRMSPRRIPRPRWPTKARGPRRWWAPPVTAGGRIAIGFWEGSRWSHVEARPPKRTAGGAGYVPCEACPPASDRGRGRRLKNSGARQNAGRASGAFSDAGAAGPRRGVSDGLAAEAETAGETTPGPSLGAHGNLGVCRARRAE